MINIYMNCKIQNNTTMKFTFKFISFLLLLTIFSCENNDEKLIDSTEVSPWCIIGFDSEERTPEQRIELIKELGLQSSVLTILDA